jgi:predicted Fe-Mo cluster-binding NifX family protein
MNIVIPTNNENGLNSKVAEHFGRCRYYFFLDEKGELIKVVENTSEHMGGSGLPPELMKKHGADALLCKGLGIRALNLCSELGIEVFVAQAETVNEMFKLWKKGGLKPASSNDACSH